MTILVKPVQRVNPQDVTAEKSTTGAVKKEDLTARNIKAVNIVFQPGSELKAAMQKAATFAWLNKLAEGKQSATTSPDSGSTGSGSEGGFSDGTTDPMD